MTKGTFSLVSVLSITVLLLGCATTPKDYGLHPSEEAAIRVALLNYESAWNKHDETGLLALLHEEFVIWAGSQRRIVYTKKEYAFDLGDIMRRYRYLSLGKPAIWIKGNHATVLVPMSVDGRNTRNTFHMVREGDTWLFLDSEF
jgi:hypothetical protein